MYFGNIGENFPYTNFHDLNLDWILNTIKELNQKIDQAQFNTIQIADPLQWDITKQYEALTVVVDGDSAYLSIQAVPYGISIENETYWQKIFDVGEVFNSIKEAIAVEDDGNSTTSSKNREVGTLVWLNDELYQVTSAITLGETYTSSNTEKVSVEELLNDIIDILSFQRPPIRTLSCCQEISSFYVVFCRVDSLPSFSFKVITERP